MADNQVLDVTKDVKWVGVLDPDLLTFDVVMETEYGTTYNSYFIDADKKAVIETTKENFWETYLEKLKQVGDPSEIEYIILDHAEPDHSGNVKNLLRIAPNAKLVGSGNAIRYMKDMMEGEFDYITVKGGDTLDLGNKTLRFINAPNLHWPDSIYTYLEEDKMLFTCDSFGAHYCDERMFDDLVDNWDDAFKYYFDVILKPYSKFMLKAIDKIKPLDIDIIAPGHGPILRSDWKRYVDMSQQYAEEAMKYPETKHVFIPFVSAYHKTGMMAEEIAAGIQKAGDITVDVCDIEHMSVGDLEAHITKCSGVLVGSPVINQNILLPVYKLFGVMTPIRDKKKLAASFGSYGWSGENANQINSNLKNLKLNLFNDGLFVKFTPTGEEKQQCREFGKAFGEALLKN
ncbi:MAG: FprA family A-type flavoprotein [Bacteroidales bacterium]|nr:FprA family A-type flavoprotein [Bacteroidales bacterium]